MRKYPLEEPDTKKKKADEERRRQYEQKFGYMQNIDGITQIMPKMSGWEVPSDVLGSYTGTGIGEEVPVQDADDL